MLGRLNDLRTFNFRAITIDADWQFPADGAGRPHTKQRATHAQTRELAGVSSRFPLAPGDSLAPCRSLRVSLFALALLLFLFRLTTCRARLLTYRTDTLQK